MTTTEKRLTLAVLLTMAIVAGNAYLAGGGQPAERIYPSIEEVAKLPPAVAEKWRSWCELQGGCAHLPDAYLTRLKQGLPP